MQTYLDNEEEDEEEESLSLFEHYRILVDKGQEPIRIDKFLLDRLPHATRNKIQNAIRENWILVNTQPTKANYKVRPQDVVTVSLPNPPRNNEIIPEDLPLDIRYEDEDVIVLHKPPGMVVHPAHANWTGTVLNALAFRYQELPENADGRPALVHRIDKDTSGLLVAAKNEMALSRLARQFFDHSIERTYYALVWGEPKLARGTIEVSIGRSPKDRRVMQAYPEGEVGKRAITHYEILEPLRYVSLLKCRLETGRTHQIRAHLQYLGHPLFNDEMYGGSEILRGTVFSKYKSFVENCFKIMPRQALHAKSLGFRHPRTEEWLQFDSALPTDFEQVLEKWRHYLQYND
ncbi:MAG: RluA family pseudouridine synthase [Microscillaceae bacterium]|nr:RluA family pseudouridine synthase [Microscillaceae bacterium]